MKSTSTQRNTDETKPCPECGNKEEHEPIDEEYAQTFRWMTVTCSECHTQFKKLAQYSEE